MEEHKETKCCDKCLERDGFISICAFRENCPCHNPLETTEKCHRNYAGHLCNEKHCTTIDCKKCSPPEKVEEKHHWTECKDGYNCTYEKVDWEEDFKKKFPHSFDYVSPESGVYLKAFIHKTREEAYREGEMATLPMKDFKLVAELHNEIRSATLKEILDLLPEESEEFTYLSGQVKDFVRQLRVQLQALNK